MNHLAALIDRWEREFVLLEKLVQIDPIVYGRRYNAVGASLSAARAVADDMEERRRQRMSVAGEIVVEARR